MFYSQTFLARKGPLGTVWCAAHLQYRLKKSHYTSTDIPSTVDRIMFPEVPIALRMSGHLLLGVVRIYSKKVDYLYRDCNVCLIGLRKAFSSIEVNLPENATTAKFESVTLPQTFDLDAMDVDFDIYLDGSPDHHMRSQEEITLQDQIPTGRDPYVVISFDEDFMMDRLPPEQDTDIGVREMDENGFPVLGDNNEVDAGRASSINPTEAPTETVDLPSTQTKGPMDTVEVQEPGPSNQTESNTQNLDFQAPGPSNQTEVLNSVLNDGNSPPGIEVMRDPVLGFSSENLPSIFPDWQNDVSEPNRSLDQGLNEQLISSPLKEDAFPSGGHSSPFQQHLEPNNCDASQEAVGISDMHIAFELTTPELAIRTTPPVRQPRPRQRKRKHFFDESTVLTNKFMKKALENSNDNLRKRREIPSAALGIWKLNNKSRKEQAFNEPLLTGSCIDICNLLKRDYISRKPHLTLEREATPEPRVATSSVPATEEIAEPRDDNFPAPARGVIPEHGGAASPAFATREIPEPTVAQSPFLEAESDPDIERLRHHEVHDGDNVLPDVLLSPARDLPSPGNFVSSPFRTDDFITSSPKSFRSEKVPWAGASTGTEVLPTPDIVASTAGTHTTEAETPRTFLEEQFDAGYTGLSDIPESVNTAEINDLHFLEADNTPAGSQDTQGVDSLSVRTRAVAQYLKRHSPIAPLSGDTFGDPSRDLSLNEILQGKTRKLCARMFFETLVLKSNGLIDVRQEQPYGDITLKLTSTLSKAQI